jgi:hypothetical protein
MKAYQVLFFVFLCSCKTESKNEPEFPICYFDEVEIAYYKVAQNSIIRLDLKLVGDEAMARVYGVLDDQFPVMFKMYEKDLFYEIIEESQEMALCDGTLKNLNPNFSSSDIYYNYYSGKTCFANLAKVLSLDQKLQWLIDDVLSTGYIDELAEPTNMLTK